MEDCSSRSRGKPGDWDSCRLGLDRKGDGGSQLRTGRPKADRRTPLPPAHGQSVRVRSTAVTFGNCFLRTASRNPAAEAGGLCLCRGRSQRRLPHTRPRPSFCSRQSPLAGTRPASRPTCRRCRRSRFKPPPPLSACSLPEYSAPWSRPRDSSARPLGPAMAFTLPCDEPRYSATNRPGTQPRHAAPPARAAPSHPSG